MKDGAKSDKEGNVSIGLSVLEKQIAELGCVLERLEDRLRDVLINNNTTPANEEKLAEEKSQCSIAENINHLTTRAIVIRRALLNIIERVDI